MTSQIEIVASVCRAVLLLGVFLLPGLACAVERPRLLVLTDIGGDPDDQQSMIRLMLYSNEFEIEGLVASSAGIRGQLKTPATKPELIRQIVEAYGEVRPNLVQHADGYPETEKLLALIKSGNAERGRDAVGVGHDTPGSRWIAEVAARPDARPLNIAIWGGQTDLAQALWQLRQERGAQALRQITAKLRVYDINDQDGIAAWMQSEFSGLFFILAQAPPGTDKREGAYRGMYLGGDETLTSRAWLDQNVINHGPLRRTLSHEDSHGAQPARHHERRGHAVVVLLFAEWPRRRGAAFVGRLGWPFRARPGDNRNRAVS